MRSLKSNINGSATIFVSLVLVFCVFASLDYVFYQEDGKIHLSSFDKHMSELNASLLRGWSDLTYNQRLENFTVLHGGERWTIFGNPFDDTTDFIGLGWEFTDGLRIGANELAGLLEHSDTNIDWYSMLNNFFVLITANFRIFEELGWFGYILRLPLVAGLIYCFVEVLWIG